MSKQIPLHGKRGRGKFVTVSDEDYDELMKYRWYYGKRGYAIRTKNIRRNGKWTSKTTFMHKQIMNIDDSSILVDHKDRDVSNNVRTNLRVATHIENTQNSKGSKRKESKSIYKGVSWSWSTKTGNSWRVCIRYNGKNINGGTFENEIIAACRYDQLARLYHKEFAYLNFPLITNYDAIDLYMSQRAPTSQFLGVHWNTDCQKWLATVSQLGKTKYIGLFNNEIDAAKARDEALYQCRHLRQKIKYNFPEDYNYA